MKHIRITATLAVPAAAVFLWTGLNLAFGQAGAQGSKAAAEQLMRDLATALQNNDVAAAQKLFASEEDFKGLFPPDRSQQSAVNIQSRLKLVFPEYVAALKDFGKADVMETNPGNSLLVPKDTRGNTAELRIYENGHISFAKDANALIELRFRIGGMLLGANGKWVFTNLVNRQEFFSRQGG